MYIEDWEKLHINNKGQLSCTMFLANYGSLDLYDEDMEKIFIIDHEQLQYDKNAGWTLIGITEKTDGSLLDHKYFCIHDDLFDIIQSTHQDNNIMLKFISNEQSENEPQCEVTEIVMTRSKIRRGLLTRNQPIIIFIERGRKFQLAIGKNNLMTSG